MTVDYRPLLQQIVKGKVYVRSEHDGKVRVYDRKPSMYAHMDIDEEDRERWRRRLMDEEEPVPPVTLPLEGAHPYRGGGRAPEPPEGFWRGAWRRLRGLFG